MSIDYRTQGGCLLIIEHKGDVSPESYLLNCIVVRSLTFFVLYSVKITMKFAAYRMLYGHFCCFRYCYDYQIM